MWRRREAHHIAANVDQQSMWDIISSYFSPAGICPGHHGNPRRALHTNARVIPIDITASPVALSAHAIFCDATNMHETKQEKYLTRLHSIRSEELRAGKTDATRSSATFDAPATL
jgi:hypothetical protein